MIRGVVYCRVSTKEQVQNLSLPVQREACEEYCRRNGIEVDRVFVEEGESAKTTDRHEFQKLLEHCRRQRSRLHRVVVYNLSRFARNTYDHHAVRAHLHRLGIRLVSVTEPIDDTSAGKLFENMLAAFHQFDNDLRRDRTVSGMRAALERGSWVWKAPLGYLPAEKGDACSLVLDLQRAPLVRRGFEMLATGAYKVSEVLAHITGLGLTGLSGKPITAQGWHRMLRNPAYRGWIDYPRWGVDRRGLWDPLVDDETWFRVQGLLSKRSTAIPTHTREHPDFPLRQFVRCAQCGGPLTAAWSKGRSTFYGYYWCFEKSCRRRRYRKERLEGAFLQFLTAQVPDSRYLDLFSALVCEAWEGQQHDARAAVRALEQRVAELKAKKKRLTEAYVFEQTIDQETYQEFLDKVEEDLTLAEMDRHNAQLEELDLEGILAFARQLVENAARLWVELDPPRKRKLQAVLFPEGVTYAAKEGFRTSVTCPLFKQLEGSLERGSTLVSPTGFEPVLPP